MEGLSLKKCVPSCVRMILLCVSMIPPYVSGSSHDRKQTIIFFLSLLFLLFRETRFHNKPVRNVHILHGAPLTCGSVRPASANNGSHPRKGSRPKHRHSRFLLMETVKVKTGIPKNPAASSAFFCSPHLRQAL